MAIAQMSTSLIHQRHCQALNTQSNQVITTVVTKLSVNLVCNWHFTKKNFRVISKVFFDGAEDFIKLLNMLIELNLRFTLLSSQRCNQVHVVLQA